MMHEAARASKETDRDRQREGEGETLAGERRSPSFSLKGRGRAGWLADARLQFSFLAFVFLSVCLFARICRDRTLHTYPRKCSGISIGPCSDRKFTECTATSTHKVCRIAAPKTACESLCVVWSLDVLRRSPPKMLTTLYHPLPKDIFRHGS